MEGDSPWGSRDECQAIGYEEHLLMTQNTRLHKCNHLISKTLLESRVYQIFDFLKKSKNQIKFWKNQKINQKNQIKNFKQSLPRKLFVADLSSSCITKGCLLLQHKFARLSPQIYVNKRHGARSTVPLLLVLLCE